MRPRFAWTVTLLAGLSATAVAQQPDSARGPRSIAQIRAQMHADSALMEPYFELTSRASLAQRAGDFAIARAIWDTAIIRHPKEGGAFYERGILRYNMRDTAGAMADLRIAVTLGFTDARQMMSMLAGRIPDSSTVRPPGDPKIRTPEFYKQFERATRALSTPDYATAKAAYDSLVERDPTFVPAVYGRAGVRVELGDTLGGLEDFKLAVALGHPEAQMAVTNLEGWKRMRERGAGPASGATPLPRLPSAALQPEMTFERVVAETKAALPPAQALAVIAVLLGVALALFTLWYQLTPEPRIVDFPKLKGERHIWIGTPRRGLFIQSKHIGFFVFGIAWCTFVYQWVKDPLVSAIHGEAFGWIFVAFSVPFVLFGLYLLMGQVFSDARRRKITTYALTNQRVILSVGANTNARTLDRLEEPTLVEHLDGTGTIFMDAKQDDVDFEKVMKAMQDGSLMKQALGSRRGSLADFAAFSPRKDKQGRTITGSGAKFEHIADAQRVYEQMLEAMAPAQSGALPGSGTGQEIASHEPPQ